MNLRELSIFKNLSDSDLNKIEANLEIVTRTYEKGSYIFRQNDIAKDLYFLLDGNIIVSKIDFNGKRSIIQNFKERVIFGEIYAYLNEAFDFSAVAEEESKVLIIKEFKKVFNLDLDRNFLLSYINLISKKCLKLSQKNQINTQYTLRQKIANYLIYNMQEDNKLVLDMTREDLADFLSTTRPSLSRELSKMADEEIIYIKGKNIKILNKNELEAMI